MKFRYIVILVFVVSVFGVIDVFGQISPQKLFTIYEGEELAEEQLKERLEYLKLFALRQSGDSIVAPVVEKAPKEYIKYVEAFVDTVNCYIKHMRDLERLVAIRGFVLQNVNVAFLSNFLQMGDSTIVFNITKQDAVQLEMLDEYKFIEERVLLWNKEINETPEKFQALCEYPKSILWDSWYFNRFLGKYYYGLRDAILELNKNFKYK